MPLHVSFQPGTRQALQAGRYFRTLANDAVDHYLMRMTAHQYRVEVEGVPTCAVRIWTEEPPLDDVVLALIAFLKKLGTDVERMVTASEPEPFISLLVGQWLDARIGEQTLFIEELRPRYSFTKRE